MNPLDYTSIKQVLQYETIGHQFPFREWLLSLKDVQARAGIRARLDRLVLGNLGDCKPLGGGIFELRFHFGPGYRVYFGQDTQAIIILLYGGEKKKQRKDINVARKYWKDYLRRRS